MKKPVFKRPKHVNQHSVSRVLLGFCENKSTNCVSNLKVIFGGGLIGRKQTIEVVACFIGYIVILTNGQR